jgi:hypothetical protein
VSSHFAVLGLNVHSGEELAGLVEAVLGTGELVEASPGGGDLLWTDPSGAALLLEMTGTSVSGVLPFFSGGGLVPVRGIALVPDDPDIATMEVLDERGELYYPVAAELVDRGALRAGGGTLDHAAVAFTGLAESITVFPDAAAFEAADGKLDPGAFVPSGLFVADGDQTPTAHALVNGTVLAAELRTNELSGLPFLRMTLATLGMDALEVVAAQTDVEGVPQPGSVVQTTVFLTGRLAPA